VSQHTAAVTNDYLNRQLGAAIAKAKRYGAAQNGKFHKSQNYSQPTSCNAVTLPSTSMHYLSTAAAADAGLLQPQAPTTSFQTQTAPT